MEIRSNNFIKKIFISWIIFSVLMLDLIPILTNISWAAENYDESVEVKGYFSCDNIQNDTTLICDVNSQTAKINFEIKVKGKGYFKSGVLKFNNDLNFKLNPDAETLIDDNELRLPEVNSLSSLNISIPISFADKESFTLDDLSKDNKVIFKGEYVDDEGILHVIEKELIFHLTWKGITESQIGYEVIKNLNFERDGQKGKILQANLVLSAKNENRLPIKSTEITIDIPVQEGLEFSDFAVSANKLSYTQGREDYNTDFSKAESRVENGEIVIRVENNGELGKINKSIGEDSYILTFIYNGEVSQNIDNITSKVSARVINYGGNEEFIENEISYNMSNAIGETVQFYRENKETPISKGYLMANSNQEKYEISYVEKNILNVSRADLVSGLEIVDIDEYFIDESGKNAYDISNGSYYKKTELSRENLVDVLGEDGYVEVLNLNDEVIGKITFDMQTNDTGMYLVAYEELVSNIKIRFSDPINDGNISIINTKAVSKLEYSKDEIRSFDKLVSHAQGFATYNEGISTDLGIVETNISISNTSSGATIEVENPELSTTVVNQGVNFKLRLNNNEDTSDLYENPVFEIRLPEVVKELSIRNIDMFYSNGELEIANVENFVDGNNQIIRITLAGSQSTYGFNKETNGTIISFNVDLVLDELALDGSDSVSLYYYNASATNYDNQVDWLITVPNGGDDQLKNGSSNFIISYKAPNQLINAQASEMVETTNIEEKNDEVVENSRENEEKNKDRVVSTKQGAQSELLEQGAPAKLATMFISVMNNTNKSYGNFKILGRIPFVGNKDILTGEDLGTTVDTILDTEVTSKMNLPYTVYYSENPYATENLNDANNNWKTDFYKMGGVKSYLIVFNDDYVLTPGEKLEFEYDYVIPADLKDGDAFYGTYATYFTENVTNISTNEGADKIGYETLKNADVNASIKCLDSAAVELQKTTFELKLENVSDVDARGIKIRIPEINGLVLNQVNGEDVSYSLDLENDMENHISYNILNIDVEKVEKNSENTIIIVFDNLYFRDMKSFNLQCSISGENISNVIDVNSESVSTQNAIFDIEERNVNTLLTVGKEYEYTYVITNISEVEQTNFDIIRNISGEAYFSKIEYIESATGKTEEVECINNLRESKVHVNSLESGECIILKYIIKCDYKNVCDSYTNSKITNLIEKDGNNLLNNEIELKFYIPQISINEKTARTSGYAVVGKDVEYEYEVANLGDYFIPNIGFNFRNSEGQEINSIHVISDDGDNTIVGTDSAYLSLESGEKVTIKINATITDSVNSYVMNKLAFSVGNVTTINKSSFTMIESEHTDGREITGTVYIDSDNDNIKSDSENKLSGIIVDLYSSETNAKVGSTITDISGRYNFKNLDDGIYYVRFNYDDNKYLVSTGNSSDLEENNAAVINLNRKCVTDNIVIDGASVGNVDLGLIDENVFDMKVDLTVENMVVQNNAENTKFLSNGAKLSKVDIDSKLINGSNVIIEYKIVVTNQGGIAGNVVNLVDYLDDGLQFDSSLNPDWYQEADGNIHTRVLKGDILEPGETRELKLILMKKMTDSNTGLIHNSVEIAEAINEKGIEDIDSTPGNRLDEDDMSYADSLVGVKTGLQLNYLPIILTVLIILIPVTFLVWKFIEKRRYV